MKIAIMSDSHDNKVNLEKAVTISNNEKCEFLLHAGDLIAPPMLSILGQFNGKIIIVWGNNEGEKVGYSKMVETIKNIELTGDIYEGEVENIKIFMTHQPRIAELAAKSGEFNICIHGHTHEFRDETVGNTRLINPGEIHGYKTDKAGFVIFNTQTNELLKIDL